MARETVYLVQAYLKANARRLNADTPIRCRSPEAAQKTAERLAITKAGVVAFSTSGDADLGEYDDEPVVFFEAGRLPRNSRTNEAPRCGDRFRIPRDGWDILCVWPCILAAPTAHAGCISLTFQENVVATPDVTTLQQSDP